MPTNKAHSVFERLRNLAKLTGRDFQAMLLLYAQERFLARLALSQHRQKFVLKGGMFLYSRYRNAARRFGKGTCDGPNWMRPKILLK
jgi:predicted nucleotidyltransferase component of viral defense system